MLPYIQLPQLSMQNLGGTIGHRPWLILVVFVWQGHVVLANYVTTWGVPKAQGDTLQTGGKRSSELSGGVAFHCPNSQRFVIQNQTSCLTNPKIPHELLITVSLAYELEHKPRSNTCDFFSSKFTLTTLTIAKGFSCHTTCSSNVQVRNPAHIPSRSTGGPPSVPT